MLLKTLVFLSINLFFIEIVSAQKLSIGVGAYAIDAKVGSNSTSLSNVGAYKIQYHSKIQEEFEFILGYTVLIQNVVSGDKAFGPLMGFSYYPFGSQTITQSSSSNISILGIRNFNPYFTLGFTQRQYQSIKSAYSGFFFGGGLEIGWTKRIALFSDLQYSNLDGPTDGKATEVTATAGITYHY